MSLLVKCAACGKRMKAPVALAGKRVRCKCGDRLLVPFPNEPVIAELCEPIVAERAENAHTTSPPQADPMPADLTDLAALAEGEVIENGRQCPDCFAGMPSDSVLCTACGYDSRTGRKFRAAVDPAQEAANAESEKAAKVARHEKRLKDDEPGKMAFLTRLVKPALILAAVALLLGGAWYIKDAVFFDPRQQITDDHLKITQNMTVKQVVNTLGRKPSSIQAARSESMSTGLVGLTVPRKLQYKDNFIKQYSKEDLAFGFTFIYVYSQRDELHIYFTPNGRVESAIKHDPLARLGL